MAENLEEDAHDVENLEEDSLEVEIALVEGGILAGDMKVVEECPWDTLQVVVDNLFQYLQKPNQN